MGEFTAGPWVKNNYGELMAANGKQVGVWGLGISHVYRSDEAEANARLIAAAPVLLEALQLITEHVNRYIYGDEDVIVMTCREAIAKALTPQS